MHSDASAAENAKTINATRVDAIFSFVIFSSTYPGGHVFKHLPLQNMSQILVEVHVVHGVFTNLQHFMKHVNRTHSIFYAEPNIQFSDGNCIEFAMRGRF